MAQTPPDSPTDSTPAGWVKLGGYNTAMQADFDAAVLAGEGIQTQIMGANTNVMDWFWQGFNPVDVFLPESDRQRALEILSGRSESELEPAEGAEQAAPPIDSSGHPLVPVAAFEKIAEMRDAQTLLAAGKIPAIPPPLAPRGDQPPGVGKRFVLWVAEKHFTAATAVLQDSAQEDAAEPRCPQCGSWRVQCISDNFLQWLTETLSLFRGGHRTFRCNACRYRAPESEFHQHAQQTE